MWAWVRFSLTYVGCEYVRGVGGRFRVSYANAESSGERDSDDDDEQEETAADRPWPTFVYTREVYIRDGLLYCPCGYTQSMLLPCSHILCVKNLTVTVVHHDIHFRYALARQDGFL